MICKNPGGGTPPPNFTQGGVMDCHPPLETAYGDLSSSLPWIIWASAESVRILCCRLLYLTTYLVHRRFQGGGGSPLPPPE